MQAECQSLLTEQATNNSLANFDAQSADNRIGCRLRKLRRVRRISQAELGRRLGILFQQVQKYEKDANRMPVSRLIQISHALDFDIMMFFKDLWKETSPTSTTSLNSQQNICEENMRFYKRISKKQNY